MKSTLFTVCACLVMTGNAAFAELSKDEVTRLEEAATIVGELRDAPGQRHPPGPVEESGMCGRHSIHEKAAFVVGGEYGSGVMSCRTAGSWSAPVFMQIAKGTWGLQIGAAQTDLILLVMNRKGVDKLLEDKVTLGVDGSVAGGASRSDGHRRHGRPNEGGDALVLPHPRAVRRHRLVRGHAETGHEGAEPRLWSNHSRARHYRWDIRGQSASRSPRVPKRACTGRASNDGA